MTTNDKNNDGNLKQALFTVSDAVLGSAILLALGVYGGAWLDQRLHTSPWLSVGLALLGGGIGLWRMVMKAQAIGKNDKSSKNASASTYDDWDKNDDWGASPQAVKSPKESTFQADKNSQTTKSEEQPKSRESSRYRLPHEGFTDE